MRAPEDFQRRLEREFGGRLRIRWSVKRGEFHIEQKVGRASLPPTFVSEADDETIRAKDGYGFVMAIRPGTRMPCPGCSTTLDVPAMRTGEVRCTFCRVKGLDGRYAAAYFPLEGDALIQHLRRIDPLNTWRDALAAEADAINRRITASKDRDLSNYNEAVAKDWFNRLVGIPQVGYTGKEHSWASPSKRN